MTKIVYTRSKPNHRKQPSLDIIINFLGSGYDNEETHHTCERCQKTYTSSMTIINIQLNLNRDLCDECKKLFTDQFCDHLDRFIEDKP